MEDADLVIGDFIINFVRVTRESQLTYSGLVGRWSHIREVGKPANLPLDCGYQPSCRPGLPLFKIFVNLLKIRTRPQRVPDPHP